MFAISVFPLHVSQSMGAELHSKLTFNPPKYMCRNRGFWGIKGKSPREKRRKVFTTCFTVLLLFADSEEAKAHSPVQLKRKVYDASWLTYQQLRDLM